MTVTITPVFWHNPSYILDRSPCFATSIVSTISYDCLLSIQDELKCQLLALKEQEGVLSLKIVQSPSKVMAEQESLKRQVSDYRDLVHCKQQRRK